MPPPPLWKGLVGAREQRGLDSVSSNPVHSLTSTLAELGSGRARGRVVSVEGWVP